MIRKRKPLTIGFTFSTALALAGAAYAQPVMDGQGALTEYGDPLYLNTTDPTGFGDNDDPALEWANGSEIDAVYGLVDNGVLYLMVAGNLESNFNKLELFFETTDGGQNKLRGDNPDVDFNGLNRMGDDGSDNGLTFDDSFAADRYMTMGGGDVGGGNYDLFANWAEILTGGGGIGRFLGQGEAGSDGTLQDGDNPDNIRVTIDNSNVGGITGSDATGGDTVDTGIEWAIPLSALGDPAGDIRIVIFINGSGHDFLSNQVAGGVNGADNLGEPREVDFNTIDGAQYVTVPNDGTGDCLALDVQNLVAGEQATFTITQGTTGVRAVTVYGLQAGSTEVNDVGGYCATFGINGVTQNRVLGGLNRVFDANGEISFNQFIPSGAQGRTVLFQSAERGTCPDECVSNLVEEVVQ